MKKAKNMRLTTSLDPQWDPSEKWDLPLEELLPLVDIFLPNMQEFLHLSHSSSIREGIAKLAPFLNRLVVKDGSQGAHLWVKGRLLSQPAYFNPEVADCVGAGDSFDAGFICKFINGKQPEECLAFAMLMGAVNTTAPGGTTAFRDMEAIRRVAFERFNIEI
jgi:sugar/nucleoside kinase (ribokinase family)